MSLTQAQLQFAAEFVNLVVAASALALLLLRPPRRRFDVGADDGVLSGIPLGQAVLSGLALAALAGAAFVHGSLIVTGRDVEWIGLGRVVAGAVVLLAFPYPGGPRTGRTPVGGILLRLGFLCWLAAGAVEFGSGAPYVTDGLLVAGSVLSAGALLRVARRSIAVRVAASGAATLLLVVVVLALSLSAVISSKVQSEELNRLSARSSVERTALTDSAAVSTDAQDVEAYLAASFSQGAASTLSDFANGSPAARSAAAALISQRLSSLPARPDAGTVAYTDPNGTSLLIPGQDRPIPWSGYAEQPDLKPLGCSAGRQGVFLIGGTMWLAASTPSCTVGNDVLGAAIVADPLDRAYLARREGVDPGVSLALLSGDTVFATAGMTAADALAASGPLHPPSGQAVTTVSGDRFVSVATVTASGPGGVPIRLELLLSDRTNAALATRDQLFRTLFLIAFGGTILALGLAIFTGDRITAGLRRLTRAAAGIAAGDASVRAGVGGDDEVASLGSTFDAMLDSVSAQAAALQAAAEDEARLRNRLQAVVAGMTDALVAVDPYGRITDFNQAAVELTGVEAHAALGAAVADVVRLHAEDGTPVGPLLTADGRGAATMGMVARGDSLIPVAVSSGALRGPAGEAAGTVLVFRDMRREQEVERMKTEFLSRIGHELRTPLTGILGYADILLRRAVPEERARAWYEEILTSARRLLRIVEMLEFFASEGAGRMMLRPEPVDVRALVNGIASSWSGRLPPNLTIGRRLPKGETVVSADQRWLTLAVDELIDNAVKFSPEGGRILIRVAAGHGNVEISVSDQGMGMTAQHYGVIFGDFVQGDNSDTRRFGGLGLGLAVVRRVVEGHGGTITCRSAPGRGTTFVIGLPARGPQPGTEAGAEAAPAAAGPSGGAPAAAGQPGAPAASAQPRRAPAASGEPLGAPAASGRSRRAPGQADVVPHPSEEAGADGRGGRDEAAAPARRRSRRPLRAGRPSPTERGAEP